MADDQSKVIDDIRDSIRSLSDDLRDLRERFDQQQKTQSEWKRDLRAIVWVAVPVYGSITIIVVSVILFLVK